MNIQGLDVMFSEESPMPGFQKTVYQNAYYLSTIKWLIFHFITYLISNIKCFHCKWVSAFRGGKRT